MWFSSLVIIRPEEKGILLTLGKADASPRKLMQNAAESGGKVDISNNKTPSVSLAGADIVLEYNIENINDFSMAGSDPERLLYVLAEAEVSRHLLSFDIDTLFSDGRIGMAQELKSRIQSRTIEHHLGEECCPNRRLLEL